MMVILDNDLANVIQAQRRQHAARERVHHEAIRTARELAPRFSPYRLATAWLRAQAAVLPPGVSARPRRDPGSLESV
jgi:hypothetical protein